MFKRSLRQLFETTYFCKKTLDQFYLVNEVIIFWHPNLTRKFLERSIVSDKSKFPDVSFLCMKTSKDVCRHYIQLILKTAVYP